jgi:hypothetical protein
MFKKSSDALSYLERTGSHATKPSPTGRIDMLPAWAQEPEAYYNSLLERYNSLCAQRDQCQQQLEALKLKLKATLSRKDYDHAMEVKRAVVARYGVLEQELGKYRMMVREASLKSWATTFYHCAKLKLNRDDFVGLCHDTQEMLGRNQQMVAKGQAEFTAEQRAAWLRHRRRQDFRNNLHSKVRGAAEHIVYSDDDRQA